MGNCLSKVCEKKKGTKRSVVSPAGPSVICCCTKGSDVQHIYDEISIESIEI
jgi:homoserine kinase